MSMPAAAPRLPAPPVHGDVLYPAAALALAIVATTAAATFVARFTTTLTAGARGQRRVRPATVMAPNE